MKKMFLYVVFLGVTILILINPTQSVYYAKKGLSMCSEIIIPSLFPFFVCSGLLVYSGFCEVLAKITRPVMKPLFNVNPTGSAAFILGIISGYPLGAVTACQLYNGNYLSKSEAERLLAFCNNSGPLFILGAVGVSIYHSTSVGVILYAAHILGAICVGLVFKNYKRNTYNAEEYKLDTKKHSTGSLFSEVLTNSVSSILTICACVVFSSVVANLFMDLLCLNPVFEALIQSGLEFVSGLTKISYLDVNLFSKLLMSAWACAFAGISVHLQVMGVISKSELSMKPYILGKLLHGIFAVIFTFLLLSFIPVSQSVFSALGKEQCMSIGFFASSVFSVFAVLSVLMIMLCCVPAKLQEKLKLKRKKNIL